MRRFREDLAFYHTLKKPNDELPSLIELFKCACSPRMLPVLLIRIQHASRSKWYRPIAMIAQALQLIIFGLECSHQARISGGLFLPHPTGVVLGAESIGSKVIIYQGVTLGATSLDISNSQGRPVIGSNVIIGAGATVLGDVNIPSGSRIKAMSLVLNSLQ